ncbi:MAG: metallopeptidase TldD-related protein, partial [Prevotella sp.]
LGDKQLDNFKYNSQGAMSPDGRSATTVTIPYEDNCTEGITTNIWNATNSRYDFAVNAYRQTQSHAATSAADEDKSPCFSDAKAEKYYEQPIDLDKVKLDRKAWQERLDAVSGVFKTDPSLSKGNVSLDYNVTRTYFVNTEGSEVVQNRRTIRVILTVECVTPDGMALPLMADFFAFDPDSLPSQQAMMDAAADLVKRIQALRAAPVANPYTGPAILSGPASGVFFHEIFGHRLEGHRLKKGGETFKNMVGKDVLPQNFQVYCDPTLSQYAGTDLNGHYIYDSEGVKSRRVDNVVNGVLRNFLMSRVPLDGFPESNGHGRASGANDPVSRQSNLIIETSKPYTEAQLREMLIAEVKKQGKDYGYYFKTVTSGFTFTGEGNSINSFNVTPVEVFRVFPDGRPDELVRGVDMIGTPLSMFSHIVAGGNDAAVFTGSCGAESGWVPVSTASPSLFVSQIETQRSPKANAIPNILTAPSFAEKAGLQGDDMVFAAMKDELKRTHEDLRVQGTEAPFYAAYSTTHYSSFDITGELSGISSEKYVPTQTNLTGHLLLGNFKRTSDFPGQPLIMGGTAGNDLGYASLRREFWNLSDMLYKNSVAMMSQKQAMLSQYQLPAELERIPDLQRSAPCTYIEENENDYTIDMPQLRNIAKELSAIFKDYKYLQNTTVRLKGAKADTYLSTTEDVNIKQPHNYVTLTVKADFEDDNNVKMSDELRLCFGSPADMPSLDELKSKVRKFADDCMETRNAPKMEDDYKGPVLYGDEAAKQVFTSNYLTAGQFYAVQSIQEDPKSLGQKIGKSIMDERISILNYTDRKEYNGEKLAGYYAMDADGFRPEPVMTIVDKGVFKMMLNRKTPAQYAEKSTASARFANNPAQSVPMVGVGSLHIKADGATKDENMMKLLLKAAKKAKKDYAYVITTPENYLSLRVYQVNVKTGERKLVKTNGISLPTKGQMKKFFAISDKENVSNDVSVYSHSIIYPSAVILDDIEINTPTMKSQKPSALTYPLLRE